MRGWHPNNTETKERMQVFVDEQLVLGIWPLIALSVEDETSGCQSDEGRSGRVCLEVAKTRHYCLWLLAGCPLADSRSSDRSFESDCGVPRQGWDCNDELRTVLYASGHVWCAA